MHIPRSYFICAVQRSGSNLLCDALSETGIAGSPEEHFLWLRPSHKKHEYIQQHNLLENPIDYVNWIKERGTSPNRVFATKVMWDYFGNTIMTMKRIPKYQHANPLQIISDLFPNFTFIRLSRRNKLKQAISQVKAAQTRNYSSFVDQHSNEISEPFYDADHITARLKFIADSEAGWKQFFHHFGIKPLSICYEEFAENLNKTVESILDFVQIDYQKPLVLSPPRRKKLANTVNEEWERRYLATQRPTLEALAL